MKRRVSLEILCVDLPWVGLEGRRTVSSLFQENVSAFCLISSSLFYSPKGGGVYVYVLFILSQQHFS